HIGTNDCVQNFQLATLGDRLSLLINQITDHSPGCLVVVAQITPMTNPTFNQRAAAFNSQIPGIVVQKLLEGRYVFYTDMFTTAVTLADGVPPDRAGYDRMALVWLVTLYYLWYGF